VRLRQAFKNFLGFQVSTRCNGKVHIIKICKDLLIKIEPVQKQSIVGDRNESLKNNKNDSNN
jgi:hypothetical protein